MAPQKAGDCINPESALGPGWRGLEEECVRIGLDRSEGLPAHLTASANDKRRMVGPDRILESELA